ncbi:peptidoglycan-binding protein [Anaerocolumna cellulosilytica]|uniref:Peptidoglycan-binding protein n=1 Tax=Anaerocolumna cellulosilytica TaxID=433286 RepID=A0A6S6R3S9_9FIRM|nr:peptidoglycan-binding protein [Anaerocolumna cellulosilytica]MBB5195486.1 hypothetical protein [Anaerocolumna cellulosilytica]BCJ96019.1 peptidoglycan-binding protein [Anaerocolumna cellulosilytica]
MDINNNYGYPPQEETQAYGKLQIKVLCELGSRPIETATVQIYHKEDPNTILHTLDTDSSGIVNEVVLPAPPAKYSMAPSENQPYSEYILVFSAPGLQTVLIDGVQILPDVTAIQKISLPRLEDRNSDSKIIIIKPHLLFGNYPAKIPEADVKPDAETGVDNPVVIPNFITVHDGTPANSSSKNYIVAFKDYIKNVVSSQIYATWPSESIYANVLATLSFTLNRYYTNWYRNQGYDFDITSSTAHDQLWIYGRSVYLNISLAVDYIFNYFLARPEILQPILTQICTGISTDCPNMMSLWGSKELGAASYQALGILQRYYGSDIYISSSDDVRGIPYPWPGYAIKLNSSGDEVKQIQEELEILSRIYIRIPVTVTDGYFGPITEDAVKGFQEIFNYPVTGIIDAATWYGISQQYGSILSGRDICL